MKVVKKPEIRFTCESCEAVNEGEPEEFIEQNTIPPTWLAKCAFCNHTNAVAPLALIAKKIGEMFP